MQAHEQRLQQQQHAAVMPQIPRQMAGADHIKQQLYQQQQMQQRQQQLRQQQQQTQKQQQARQQQLHLQQLQQQQQQQQQQQLRQQLQSRQTGAAYAEQGQQPAAWSQPAVSNAQQQAYQQAADMQSQAEKENQARMAQFWEIQGQIRQRFLAQLQALKDNPFMRSQHISQANRVWSGSPSHAMPEVEMLTTIVQKRYVDAPLATLSETLQLHMLNPA